MKKNCWLVIVLLLLVSCAKSQVKKQDDGAVYEQATIDVIEDAQVDVAEIKVIGDIPVPNGFIRSTEDKSSFGYYLRMLPLKPIGTRCLEYDGAEIFCQHCSYAVIDMEIGDRDLQQCADAVIRLRSEYLYAQQRYDDIHFNFTNGFNAEYKKWANGNRIKVVNNKAYYVESCAADYSYANFIKYLERVFEYAGSYSLSKELVPKSVAQINIGDVFITGGFPGHAMIVVDMAENDIGERAIMVAQSYMPARNIHIVTNLNDLDLSPWYVINGVTKDINFPEYYFTMNDLKTFEVE